MTTSKLNEAFWKWFGDSKVVDANGDPLIVYRGQRRIPFPTRFATTLGRATSSFTAIPELANVYAKTRDWFGAAADFEKGANVGAYYLSIQNPADLRAFGPQANLGEMLSSLFHVDLGQDRTEGQTFGQDDFVQVITGLASRANKTTFFFESDIWDTGDSWLLREADSPSVVVDDLSDHEGNEDVFTFYFDSIKVDVFALADSKNFTALLKRAGYDGIFHQDVGQLAVEFLERPPVEIPGIGEEPDYAFDTFRPFEQTQIKSATGNRGTWDRDDPDITHNPPGGLRGEWWIDDSGGATFADGNVGDQNHEIIAFWSALGVDPDEAFSLGEILPNEGLSEEQASGLLEMGAEPKAVEFFSGDGGDARDFMMVERAWIRVADNNFQLWTLDDEALGRIRDFINNEYPEDEDPLEDEFQIEELRKGGVHLSVSGSDLLESGKSADALKYSAQRERTGMYNPQTSERTYYEIGHRGLKSKLWYGDEFNITVEPAEFDIDGTDVDPRNLHNEWALRMPWHGRYDPYSDEVSIMGGTMTEDWRQPSEQMLDRLRETFGADVKIVQFNPGAYNPRRGFR
jgi:hypothetical protein